MSSRPDALQQFLNPIAKLLRSFSLLAQKRPILGSIGRKGFNSKPVSREREVMERVVAGLLNKRIAGVVGTSVATVKIQRRHVMQR